MKKIMNLLTIPISLSLASALPVMSAQASVKPLTIAAWGDGYGTTPTPDGKKESGGYGGGQGGKEGDWKEGGKKGDWDNSGGKGKGEWGGYGGKSDDWKEGGKKGDWDKYEGKGKGEWGGYGGKKEKYEDHDKYCEYKTVKKWKCAKDCYWEHGKYYCEPKCGWYKVQKYICYH